MTRPSLDALRVAIISDSRRQRILLRDALERHGLQPFVLRQLNEPGVAELDGQGLDVALVDLDDEGPYALGFVELLQAHSALPLVFNDRASMLLPNVERHWDTRLIERLKAGAADPPRGQRPPAVREPAAVYPAASAAAIVSRPRRAERVWVLGASLGGPQALKAFLGALPGDLPVAFVIAQHIGARHLPLLAEQLDRCTAFQVAPAQDRQALHHGQALLAPVEARLTADGNGLLRLLPPGEPTRYHPSIDQVMTDLARRYGANCGAIVFSGMGNDGAQGCVQVHSHGGQVWAQDAASCVIGSMPDHARASGTVSHSGTPAALAARLCALLGADGETSPARPHSLGETA